MVLLPATLFIASCTGVRAASPPAYAVEGVRHHSQPGLVEPSVFKAVRHTAWGSMTWASMTSEG